MGQCFQYQTHIFILCYDFTRVVLLSQLKTKSFRDPRTLSPQKSADEKIVSLPPPRQVLCQKNLTGEADDTGWG